MARTKLEINKAEFQKVVNDLESNTHFTNPSHLWKAVEETTWGKSQMPRPLTAAVCYARAKELGIIFKTVPGKRGITSLSPEQKEAMQVARKSCRPRSEKMKRYADTFNKMRKRVPTRFLPLVEQVEKGSLRAALKLQCLDCTCFQPVEIKQCQCPGCPLFPHRPYQMSKGE